MTQVKYLEQAIEGFRSSSQDEMEFLFDSLLHSLAVASKNASTQSFERANPSLRHAVMLSGSCAATLKIYLFQVCMGISMTFLTTSQRY